MRWRRARTLRALALLVGLGLAVAATAALVLTEDLQVLRLAVVAALWAFLIAAFLVGQRRSGAAAAAAPDPGAELALARSHELELEVASRREFELRTEVTVRREIEGALREDLAAMRGDLDRLRHDILERWDGELRVERIAVRAESTRVTGFGATLHALQDEARRLHDEGRPLVELQTGRPQRDELDVASTVEFSVVPARPTVDDVVADTRSRHLWQEDDGEAASVDAATLLRRLEAEAQASPVPEPRRRRYRDDDETNDVLARLLGR